MYKNIIALLKIYKVLNNFIYINLETCGEGGGGGGREEGEGCIHISARFSK